MITTSKKNTIKSFILNFARPLDRSLFIFNFKTINKDEVVVELMKYQNEDGGFGKAIEPDFRLPGSSPMATTIAMQYVNELQVAPTHPIIKDAINYFLNTYDQEQKRWFTVPEEVNNYPHAPWWHVNKETKNAGVESNWANPNAEIVSYLVQYSELVPSTFLQEVLDLALMKFSDDIHKMEMHDLLCYIRLFEVLPNEKYPIEINKLVSRVQEVVQTTTDAWENYGPKPLTFAPTPKSLLYPFLKDEIEVNIQYEIKHLNERGYCEPNWAWGQYDQDWLKAKEEWKGYLTVKLMKSLKEYGYLEKETASE
ncbi:hypothetical protein CIB95_12870 [Lottiidibacillus patelloidae]|uniref:Prenyltransferase n=1 Tax=Lottiidibacillus patelloidae TaxID=2670334 RepID=A0A263BRG6_9BACI|nr:hypothetical protein [Lottiidibacillus patelloidae]OZM56301.1 hypothetical protein CIB95_12870 [Lottiidibacillus patelloidae]